MTRNHNRNRCQTGSIPNHHVNAVKQKQTPRPPTSTPPVPKSRFFNSRPYIAIPESDKKKAMQKSYVLYSFKRKILKLLHPFLCTKNLALATDKNIDLQTLLRITKDNNAVDPTGFLPNPILAKSLQEAIFTRNEVDHQNLNMIDRHWQSRIASYAALCTSLNGTQTAMEIQSAATQLVGGSFKGIVVFAFKFDSVFNENQSFGLAQIVYAVLMEYLADVIRGFVELKLGNPNHTMDLYPNILYIQDQLRIDPDFLDVGGLQRGDAKTIQIIFETRMDNAHGGYIRSSRDWQTQLEAIIQILNVLKSPDKATKVQEVLDKLILLKTRGSVVSNADFNFME